jgi:Spy/CpxP family protein refolding chaperone
MKHANHKPRTGQLLIAGAILASSVALAALPGRAWAADPTSTQASTTKSSATTGVDGLIAHLHQELKITPAQESQFQKLADVMRENTDTMRTLAKKRSEAAGTMTAVDDLKSYAEISQAHADGAKKMVPVFQSLYDSLSDEQKKLADTEFREHYTTHHHHKST